MNLILKSKLFWASTLLISAVIFVGFNNSSQLYQANIDVIIVPKNDKTASQMDTILANAVQIPKSLSFYNETVDFNKQLGNQNIIFPSFTKESDWKSKIDVKRQGNSSIIRLSVLSKNSAQAKDISRAVALNLTRDLSQLYNIKTDLDSRIVSQSMSNYASFYTIPLLTVAAIILGFLITFVVFIISAILSDAITRHYFLKIKMPKILAKNKLPQPESEPYVFGNTNKDQDQKPETLSTEPEAMKEHAIHYSAKAAAPDNLPVVDDDSIFKAQPMKPEEPKNIDQTKKTSKVVTPEEVRERLNKLLSGRM